MTLQPGHTIEGKYRIVRLLGKGAMGAVYEGENERIRRRVAIKVLHTDASHRADVVQRFEREAQAAGRIGSAHIVEVLDLGNLFTGERFMVMEYLDGESLGARIKKQERMTPLDFMPMLHQLLDGLASAHDAGIVHRDLKPDNIYLVAAKNQQNFVKILDFGVSKFTAGTAENELAKTNTGMILGTPYYMSPEQVRAESLDARSDLYSVGVIMYQALTGKLPFRAGKFTELAMKITVAMYDPPETIVPNLDPALSSMIAKAMHHDRNQRFQTAKEFQTAIEQWLTLNGAMVPGFSRLATMPPTSIPPGLLLEAQRIAQANSGANRQSVPSGMLNAPLLGSTHVTPMGTSNSNLGIPQAAPPPSTGMMIAVGLFGTLFLAVAGILVYTFVIDKPASATPAQAASAAPTMAVATPPPPPTQTAAPEAPSSTAPAASASAASTSIELEDTTPTTTSKPTSGGSGSSTKPVSGPKTAPTTGGRKMTGEL